MRLIIVRHAVALRRSDWRRDDRRRPLTPKGERQADGLVELLAPFDIDRIYSSPFVRCVDTVQPLAAKLGLAVEETHLLAERAEASIAPHVVDLGGESVVLCSHGDVIPALLDALLDSEADRPCAKGSTWILDDIGGDSPRSRYLPPPA